MKWNPSRFKCSVIFTVSNLQSIYHTSIYIYIYIYIYKFQGSYSVLYKMAMNFERWARDEIIIEERPRPALLVFVLLWSPVGSNPGYMELFWSVLPRVIRPSCHSAAGVAMQIMPPHQPPPLTPVTLFLTSFKVPRDPCDPVTPHYPRMTLVAPVKRHRAHSTLQGLTAGTMRPDI